MPIIDFHVSSQLLSPQLDAAVQAQIIKGRLQFQFNPALIRSQHLLVFGASDRIVCARRWDDIHYPLIRRSLRFARADKRILPFKVEQSAFFAPG